MTDFTPQTSDQLAGTTNIMANVLFKDSVSANWSTGATGYSANVSGSLPIDFSISTNTIEAYMRISTNEPANYYYQLGFCNVSSATGLVSLAGSFNISQSVKPTSYYISFQCYARDITYYGTGVTYYYIVKNENFV